MEKPELLDQIFDAMADIESAKTVGSVTEILRSRLKSFGVEQFMIGQIGGLQVGDPLLAGTYDAEWQERFFKYKYESKDPTITKLLAGADEIEIANLRKSQSRGSLGWKIMNEAAEFNIMDGWAYALTGPNGYISALSFVGPALNDSPDTKNALRLLGMYAHSRLQALTSPRKEKSIHLTQREKDVLSYVAQGKNDHEIGEILCISETTVHTHVERAKRRLGVSKRTPAVIEALRSNLISI